MDKHTFIKKVLSLYSFVTDKDDEGSYYDTYSRVLTKKIDYEKLFDIFASEHKDKFPPTAAWLKEQAKLCYLDYAISAGGYIQVKVYDPRTKAEHKRDCFPKGTTIEQMIRTYEKKFNCTGWQILEVY